MQTVHKYSNDDNVTHEGPTCRNRYGAFCAHALEDSAGIASNFLQTLASRAKRSETSAQQRPPRCGDLFATSEATPEQLGVGENSRLVIARAMTSFGRH